MEPRPGVPIGESLGTPTEAAPLLVLLDNCEHVLDAAADVAEELLRAGPAVQVLATSREPLRLAAEKVFSLRPLSVPASVDDPAAATSPSVVLFTTRAQAVDDAFALDEQTLPWAAQICRALDGIPLALEIAAARVRAMGVQDIADRLSARFRLLRGGTRRTPDRHRSLRAVIDWSYELLEPAEQELWTMMAVYSGGFDLSFAGTAVHVPDSKGVRDLSVLLAQPGREVAALDLAAPALAGPANVAGQAGAVDRWELQAPGDLGERVDVQARAAYAARIRELQADLDEADAVGDVDSGARAQQEMDFLVSELAGAYGMHGPRRAGDPAEKARSAVTARIRSAIGKIADVHPDLGAHLAHSVHTGRFCSYRPESPTRWRVSS